MVGACHVVPAESEGGINRFQYGIQPLWQITLSRDFERNTTAANFCLRAQQTLAHGLRRDEKRLGDACCIHAQYRLQHTRCVHRWVDRWVSANEAQFWPFIGRLSR